MESVFHEKYNDKWKRFLINALKNIDFLAENVSETVLSEITYSITLQSFQEGAYLFKQGKP